MSYIKELRKMCDSNVYDWDVLEDILYKAGAKEVHEEFEEGGRWSNFRTTINEVQEGEEVAYFAFWREVPATECQDGMDLEWGIYEVVPKEVVKIEYVPKEEGDE